jgi:hypothetical protein
MPDEKQGDVGLYFRIPVELDRRLRTAAAAESDGYLRHGAFKPFVLNVLARGLGVIELGRRELEEREADAARMGARKRKRGAAKPRKRRVR